MTRAALNPNDQPTHLHEWAELDHIAALEREAQRRESAKLTAADLDAADARRNADVRTWSSAATAALRGDRPRIGLWQRVRGTVRIAWLHWTISSGEQWIAYAERDGVLSSENLRQVRFELEALRVDLALAEAELS